MAGCIGDPFHRVPSLRLPGELSPGPDWLLLILVAALTIPATISRRLGNWRLSQTLGYVANSVVTLAVGISQKTFVLHGILASLYAVGIVAADLHPQPPWESGALRVVA